MAKIVLIDDDDAVRRTIVRMLEVTPHEVHEAADGDAGVALCQSVRPDLVITDLMMPQKEGIETIRTLKQDQPSLKILAISGGGQSGSVDFLDMARSLGADEGLQKPFRRAELVEVVNRLLGV